ncbi:MAG: transposase, partial [Kiritimatiellia bacterium]
MKAQHWHHAPLHRFSPNTVYMLTAGTYKKSLLFLGEKRLTLMQDLLLQRMEETNWIPHAWACFPNHYHVVMMAPNSGNIQQWVKGYHSKLAIALNKMDKVSGRKVMYQYWDRCITYDNSYYARLHYVIHNPVKHGFVKVARDYPFCSARWFEKNNPTAFQ